MQQSFHFPNPYFSPATTHKINKNNKKIREDQTLLTPSYFDFLSPTDQIQYRKIQQNISSPDKRYTRNKRVETFNECLEEIKNFCIRNDEDDWKRCLVCGIIWLNKPSNNESSQFNFESYFFDSETSKFNSHLSVQNKGKLIAINIRQLGILLSKSKSSINGAFSKMKYTTIPTRGQDQELLLQSLPYLNGKYFEMRLWTIRKLEDDTSKQKTQNEDLSEFPLSSFSNLEDDSTAFNEFGSLFDEESIFNPYTESINNPIALECGKVDMDLYDLDKYPQCFPDNNQNTQYLYTVSSVLTLDGMCEMNKLRSTKTISEIMQFYQNFAKIKFILYFLYILYYVYRRVIMAFRAGSRVPRVIY